MAVAESEEKATSRLKLREKFIAEVPVGVFVINLSVANQDAQGLGLKFLKGITAPGEIYDDTRSIFVNVRDVDGTGRDDKWDFTYVRRLTLRPDTEEEISP